MLCSGSVNRRNKSVDSQNGYLEDETSLVAGCILLHFEAIKNAPWILQQYTICASDLDIHCYPFIVRKLVEFFDKIALYADSDVDSKKIMEDKNLPKYGSELHKPSLPNETGSSESANILLDHLPQASSENDKSFCNLENIVEDMRIEFSKIFNLRDQKLRPSKASLPERTIMSSRLPVNSSDSSVGTSINRDAVLANLKLGSMTMHFHDASCIIATIVVPLAKSFLTVSENILDIVCSTEGALLSTSWWPQVCSEYLWGPLSSNLPPILNLSLKKRITPSQNLQNELNFYVEHVSCVLPPDFLAMFMGYLSLPDWSPYKQEVLTAAMDIQDFMTFGFEIVDSNVIAPADNDCHHFLKIDIKQLFIAFSENSDRSSVTKNIPSACCIGAGKFSDRSQCLDLFGCDLSLSLLLMGKDAVNSLDKCEKLILVASLTADIWVRIPCYFETDSVSYPVCIMGLVNDCLIDIEGTRMHYYETNLIHSQIFSLFKICALPLFYRRPHNCWTGCTGVCH